MILSLTNVDGFKHFRSFSQISMPSYDSTSSGFFSDDILSFVNLFLKKIKNFGIVCKLLLLLRTQLFLVDDFCIVCDLKTKEKNKPNLSGIRTVTRTSFAHTTFVTHDKRTNERTNKKLTAKCRTRISIKFIRTHT